MHQSQCGQVLNNINLSYQNGNYATNVDYNGYLELTHVGIGPWTPVLFYDGTDEQPIIIDVVPPFMYHNGLPGRNDTCNPPKYHLKLTSPKIAFLHGFGKMRPRQCDRYSADDIFKRISFNELI